MAHFNIDNSHCYDGTVNFYNESANRPNHMITIVGWDDNYFQNSFCEIIIHYFAGYDKLFNRI